jgi:hypothetical protein
MNCRDASTAIVGRIVLLLLANSWLGKEDHNLEPALHTELTGILNWALEGLRRLTVKNANCFTRLQSADEAITAMRDLASPVAAFVPRRVMPRVGNTLQNCLDHVDQPDQPGHVVHMVHTNSQCISYVGKCRKRGRTFPPETPGRVPKCLNI